MPSEENRDLIPSLRNTILSPMTDPMADIGEIMIDSIFEDGLLKEIPIIRTIASFAKMGVSLRERNLAKNTYAFIYGLRNQQIPQDKLEKYRKRMEDPKQAEKELGYSLILLDKETQIKKAELYGKAYRLFINENISWNQYLELTEAISRMFMADFSHFNRIASASPLQAGVRQEELYGFQRLKGLGLVAEEFFSGNESGLILGSRFSITLFGQMLYKLIITD